MRRALPTTGSTAQAPTPTVPGLAASVGRPGALLAALLVPAVPLAGAGTVTPPATMRAHRRHEAGPRERGWLPGTDGPTGA